MCRAGGHRERGQGGDGGADAERQRDPGEPEARGLLGLGGQCAQHQNEMTSVRVSTRNCVKARSGAPWKAKIAPQP